MKENAKKDFKKIGEATLVGWLLFTLLVFLWPYALLGWPDLDAAVDSWGDVTLILSGFFMAWIIGWVHFIWEPKE